MNILTKVAINCLKEEAQSILDLIPQLDANFEKAVDIILRSNGKLVITGVGKSGHIGAKIAATLSSTGTPSFFLNPLDAYHGDLGAVEKDDVVMAISNSGQTDELLRLFPNLLERKIPIIGISGDPESLLAKYSTAHLLVKVRDEAYPLRLAPTCSTTATLAMGDALACALMSARHFQSTDFASFHPGGTLGRRLLTKAKDVMRKDDLPVVSVDMSLGNAIILISQGRLGLCVAIEDKKVVGIITDGDVRRAMEHSKNKPFDLTVGDIMTRHPKCVDENARLSEIERIMHENKIHAVLVLDANKELLGIVDSFSIML